MNIKGFVLKITQRTFLLTLLVLISGLCISLLLAHSVRKDQEILAANEFHSACDDIQLKISERLNAQAQLLRSGAALFASSDSVSRENWKTFYQNSNININLPGILGYGYTMIVPEYALNKHISQIRGDGFPEYKITPVNSRAIYTSIIYLEPFEDRNLRAFGYDMFSEPVRRKAMELARDSNKVSVSGKVILVQETSTDVQAGVIMYTPVYNLKMPVNSVLQRRAAIKGWVYSPCRMNDLMNGLLGRWDLITEKRIHLQIFDGDTITDKSLIYDSQDITDSESRFAQTFDLPVEYHGTKWTLHFIQHYDPATVFKGRASSVLISGIIITLLLCALNFSLINTRQRALQIAGELTTELRKSKERFQTILNSAAEGIYGVDLNSSCTFVNNSCIKILGYNKAEELLGKNMHRLIHHSHPDGTPSPYEECNLEKTLKKGIGTHAEDCLWKADGMKFPAEYWAYPVIVNNKIEGAVVTFFDITERKNAEDLIKKARLDAEIANSAKSDFLLNIGHEFRTPLNAVIGYAELLETNEGNKTKDYTEPIKSSSRRLLEMINNLIELIRAEKAEIELSYDYADTADFFSSISKFVAGLAREKNLNFRTVIAGNVPQFILIDAVKLKQVIINIAENAVKYTDKGEVLLKIHARDANFQGLSDKTDLFIEVKDTGKGISDDFRKNLFEAFSQEGKKTILSGMGVGLGITQHFVQAMKGTISVESKPGEGSTFIVILPGIEYKGEKTEIKSADITKPEISEKERIDKTGIKDLKGLVSELEGGLHNVYLSLKARQPIGEVKSFGQALMALGEKHSCNLIYDYGKSLSDSSDNFDIEGMLKLIKSYPSRIEELKI